MIYYNDMAKNGAVFHIDILNSNWHNLTSSTLMHAVCQRGCLAVFITPCNKRSYHSDKLLYHLLEKVKQAKEKGRLLRECGWEIVDQIRSINYGGRMHGALPLGTRMFIS